MLVRLGPISSQIQAVRFGAAADIPGVLDDIPGVMFLPECCFSRSAVIPGVLAGSAVELASGVQDCCGLLPGHLGLPCTLQ